ncbi:MAG: tRNA (N(6)-L-threonylcarbamoyladenosine(37)-C(2))-methylthiotransferase MtaB [Ignavibacteriales bacterium CG18_big_fil_WC_8_21_14_2_50_31_20]|nr:MAG: tRNA (N(6)-L-threonylcarbamoyladenosine(37)-C(2))-methylthiotransferase MtaB [Ignavibacteriales bacterium CG18_big_fil_WC_8_21_14_2_50_31_20]
MSSKVAFHTLGCKLNFAETSTIGSQFVEKGFSVVDFNADADVYVINTCTVTDNADKECRQIVRRALRTNPNAYIIVTGCYAQLQHEEISKIDGVDAILGSNEKFNIFSIIPEFSKDTPSCIQVTPTEKLEKFNFAYSSEALGRTRAFFKIQDGCDYKCTFCTIPKARGRSRSTNPEFVLDEFKKLIDNGYKEIILTGVNVGDYGKHIRENLYNLLTKMLEIDADYRIRISSIEPNLLTDDIINLTANSSKMVNHFHIPLQSGSSKILSLMQRRYNVEYYKNLIHKVKEKVENVGIGVDVIVGFPNETNYDFLETYNFIKALPVSYLHVFTYSERPDTPAIKMENSVPLEERKRRSNMLRMLSEKKKTEYYNSMLNKNVTVLFEEENHNGVMFGWTSNYVRVKQEFNKNLINKLSQNKICGIEDNICISTLI